MDVYGLPAPPDAFPIDDLLDLSNDDLFSSSPSSDHHYLHPPPPPDHTSSSVHRLCLDSSSTATTTSSSSSSPPSSAVFPTFATDFAHELCVPSDYAAELEWLSRFVDDSFADIPASELAGTPTALPDAAFSCCGPRSKRSGPPGTSAAALSRIRPPASEGAEAEGIRRRCSHCASEKTPQWRAGPLGPKTLCNACGVRYKSGRLVPEYRPAASPTFVLTQHSNSHRKVMELRRQKEARQGQQQGGEGGGGAGQAYRHPRDFEVC